MLKYTTDLSKLYNDKWFRAEFDRRFQRTDVYMIREYKKQSPVLDGFLRNSVETSNRQIWSYKVASSAGSGSFGGGVGYPIFVHEGTLQYKGDRDYGYTTGRIRASNFYGFGTGGRDDMVGMMAGLSKRGYIKGIRPNKFALRATIEGRPKVLVRLKQDIKELIKMK